MLNSSLIIIWEVAVSPLSFAGCSTLFLITPMGSRVMLEFFIAGVKVASFRLWGKLSWFWGLPRFARNDRKEKAGNNRGKQARNDGGGRGLTLASH